MDSTERRFKSAEPKGAPSSAVNVFFDDIRLTYGGALKETAALSASGREIGRQTVVLRRVSGAPSMPAASKAVLASILHNAKAYDVVASTKTLTVSLDVYSAPEGASISYRTRGGVYQSLDHETDWHIQNLPRAVYLIRFQKAGYQDKEVTFDAINNPGTSVRATLEVRRAAP